MEVLQEVYFGRGPIIPLQNQLNLIREKLADKPVTTTTNIDPDILKFNRLVEKVFGFNSFALYIQPNHLPNAYAIPVDTYFTDVEKMKIRSSLTANPNGFKYNSKTMGVKVSLIVAVHIGLLENKEFTNEEIMATILHEIGHGFFEAVNDPDGTYTVAKKLVGSLTYALDCAKKYVKSGKKVTSEIVDKELSAISGWLGNMKSNISRLVSNGKKKIFKESMADNMNKNRLAYTNEKFADTFAAMYGYAAEAHSVDVKIFKYIYDEALGVKTYPKIVETLKMYKWYFKDLIAYIFNTQDEHPEELARIKTAVDYIKHELSKEGLDPKIKNQLVDQLNRLNKLIEDYKNYPRDKDSMRILRLFHVKLYEKFGGDRREKDTDNNALFDYIDQRYKEVMNNALSDSEDAN